jgi:aminoglycoside phosphotransferase (APT) family kinase protein
VLQSDVACLLARHSVWRGDGQVLAGQWCHRAGVSAVTARHGPAEGSSPPKITTSRELTPGRLLQGMDVSDAITALLARHLPGYEVRSLAELGGGLDNIVYEVNRDLVVRFSREADHAVRRGSIEREVAVLTRVTELSTLPVPELVFADPEAGFLAYTKLPGVPLHEHPVPEPSRLAAPLGRFLSGLHRAPLEAFEDLVPRDTGPLTAWLSEAEEDYRDIATHLPAPARARVEDFLAHPPPAEPRAVAFCHNDLGAEHVLVAVEASRLTGVIDWTDAAIADPAHDLALIYRDLGPRVFDLTLTHYECDSDHSERERSLFYARCALLEDIAYGLRSGERVYAEAGLAHLDWTFA